MDQRLHIKSQDLAFICTTSFSMWPFLRPGEKILVKRIPAEDLRIGDIILYRATNQVVCHRLVKKIKDKGKYLLYARGDNSGSSPELISEKVFFGKAIGILRNGTMINLAARRQQFINRLIVEIGPLVTRFKPYYVMFRKFVRDYK